MAYRVDLAICCVIVDDERQYVETRFLDGTRAATTVPPEAPQIAQELGYDDPWEMVVDHEIAHSWLAFLDGHVSNGKWAEAHGEDRELDSEEEQVVDFQKKINTDDRRPWDHLRKPFRWYSPESS